MVREVLNGIHFVQHFPPLSPKKSNTYVININTFIVEFTFCPRGWKELQICLSLEEYHCMLMLTRFCTQLYYFLRRYGGEIVWEF